MIRVLLIFFVLFNAALAFADEKLKVVTTFTVIADIARNVAGDAAQVVSITKPGTETVSYTHLTLPTIYSV